MTVPSEQRRLAAIMFTDMVGYSALAQRDDALALELLEEHRQILRSIFLRFHGTEIKTIGDAFMVEFQSALEAAQCAIEIQRTLAKRNHDVARQIRNALEARFEKLAPTDLKNIELPMDLFRIVLPWEKQAARVAAQRERKKRPLVLIVALLALLVLAGVWMLRSHPKSRSSIAPIAQAPAAKSVAVLPFVNMSSDKENEYLSDGITEDLSTALTQVKGLHVPARTSSFVFKGKTEDIRKIGEQLHVATVLEGSVSKAGNKLRITAQLVNVADGFHLWAANYDREMTDILDIRSDISRRVVDALKVQLGVEETERLARKPTEMTEAYEAYLLGRYELNKFTEAGFTNAVTHFKRAM